MLLLLTGAGCEVSGAYMWLQGDEIKGLGFYSVLKIPSGPCYRALVRSVWAPVCWGITTLLYLFSWLDQHPANSASPWFSVGVGSWAHPCSPFSSPGRLYTPHPFWQDDLFFGLLTLKLAAFCLPNGMRGHFCTFSMTLSSDGEKDKGIQTKSFLCLWRSCSLVRTRPRPQPVGSWALGSYTWQQSQFQSLSLCGSFLSEFRVGWKSPLLSAFLSTYLRYRPFLRVWSTEGRILRLIYFP